MSSPTPQSHPFLDPNLSERCPAIIRSLYKQLLAIEEGPDGYNALLNKLFHSSGDDRSLEANLATASYYMNESMHYVRGLLEMLSEDLRANVTPRDEVLRCSDVGELMSMLFNSDDPIVKYEAQRKLYLTQLFFDIDHSWEVQRGGEHREYVEGMFQREVFSHLHATRRADVCYSIRPDGESIDYSVGRLGSDEECWSFDVQELALPQGTRNEAVQVYYYSCRFKREVVPYQYRRGAERYELISSSLPGLRRSASIASKMIRKGETDPRWTRDLIGAMFIVNDLRELEALKDHLYDLFGGFFRVRNIVDTIAHAEDRDLLNPQSAEAYKVYKAEIDVLYNPPKNPQPMPYYFTVEIQLYTLEHYLRTIHSSHYASHQALKRRQFLEGVLPHLFPESIYGEEIVSQLASSVELPGEATPRLPDSPTAASRVAS